MTLGPLDLWAMGTRQALIQAGMRRVEVATAAGPQCAFIGGGGPELVLLHGAGDQAGTWAMVAPDLLKRHALLIPDLAGHGDSAPKTGPIETSAIVAGLEAVLASRSSGHPVTIAGNSLGAWMAMVLADRNPDWFARVVAVNGGPLTQPDSPVNLLPANREEARETVAATRDAAAPPLPDLVLDDLVRLAKEGPLARFASTASSMAAWTLEEARLRDFAVPVRLIWGTSDRLMPLAYADRLLAALPDARLVTLDRCGHVPQQEAPARFLAALRGIMDETSAGGPA